MSPVSGVIAYGGYGRPGCADAYESIDLGEVDLAGARRAIWEYPWGQEGLRSKKYGESGGLTFEVPGWYGSTLMLFPTETGQISLLWDIVLKPGKFGLFRRTFVQQEDECTVEQAQHLVASLFVATPDDVVCWLDEQKNPMT